MKTRLRTLPPMKNDDLKQVDVTLTKPSIEEPPELELKDLPSHLEYAFLEGTDKLPVIISKELKEEEKAALLKVLKSHKRAIAWKISDIKGIDPSLCTHKILMEDDFKPAVQHQRRVNLKIHELNDATRKDHFPLPFMDQMLERLAGNEYYCFLDGFSRYFQIPIDPQDQEKTTFTCPYGMFSYRRMPFSLCNAPGTFQRCMMASFHDMIEETMEVFMDDFSVFGDSFSSCLSHLDKMLKWLRDEAVYFHLNYYSLQSTTLSRVVTELCLHPPTLLLSYLIPILRMLFSSTNTLDYTLTSSDYSLALPGNTSSDSSEDLSKDLLASLTISPFHYDPYMKVMQSYNATSNESPFPLPQALITPPTILPLPPVLPPLPLFDPRDFFLSEEILLL
ncbi:reverse transcriptase domain-containing protein [Tanacetum coccineum]